MLFGLFLKKNKKNIKKKRKNFVIKNFIAIFANEKLDFS